MVNLLRVAKSSSSAILGHMPVDRELSAAVNRLVSERLRSVRRGDRTRKGPMTQAKFADFTGVSKATVVNIENCRQGATLAVLYKIAAAFDLEVSDLLPTTDEVRRANPSQERPERIEDALPEWADWIEESAVEWVNEENP